MTNKSNAKSGLNFSTVLFLIFLILKLTGYITWSWLWVTSPLWISIVVVIFFLVLFGLNGHGN